ncbi:class I SAM-dependent methyltransferase [Nocardioides sp. W3-2-3]|uniref:class I SAM-dependent methyltransferase n=1 Tax=Nocardioides convexus TaxID=2712224 RepID=UPI0024186888|nr:class I SAM-dependent methyltransferase [Nocardioides convexus]NHA00852.1 class I SAM-dependent methyltransferase [Nocardioides convexus]
MVDGRAAADGARAWAPGPAKLTEHLVALGHDVHATDPDPRMLDRLGLRLPEQRVSQTSAEEIPAADATYDLVVAGEAFEYFDAEKALPEIARVLKRGGTFAIIANLRDERIPWVKRLGNIIGHHTAGAGLDEAIEASPYFGPAEDASFKQWQVINRDSVQDLVRSLPGVAGLERTAQESRLREVLAFYDDFGRGMDGMQAALRHRVLPGGRRHPAQDRAARAGRRPGHRQPGRAGRRGHRPDRCEQRPARRRAAGRRRHRDAADRLPLSPAARMGPWRADDCGDGGTSGATPTARPSAPCTRPPSRRRPCARD